MFRWLASWFGSRSAYRQLVHRAGDERIAERLISFEIQRAPQLSRERAIRRALERLEYERSR